MGTDFHKHSFALVNLMNPGYVFRRKEWLRKIRILRNEYGSPAKPKDSWASDCLGAMELLGVITRSVSLPEEFICNRRPTEEDRSNFDKAFFTAKWGIDAARLHPDLSVAYDDAKRRAKESRQDSRERKRLEQIKGKRRTVGGG